MLRSLWRPAVAAAVACLVAVAVGGSAPAGYADAGSPACVTPHVDQGTLAPAMPGTIVNPGTATVRIVGRTEFACGRARDGSLHLWAPDPTWYAAPTAAGLSAH